MGKKKDVLFRAKNFGYGWYPATWQAWIIIVLYICLVIVISLVSENYARSGTDYFFYMVMPIFALTMLLIAISYHKGEKPRWSWGRRR